MWRVVSVDYKPEHVATKRQAIERAKSLARQNGLAIVYDGEWRAVARFEKAKEAPASTGSVEIDGEWILGEVVTQA
jgi:hypothetical protein